MESIWMKENPEGKTIKSYLPAGRGARKGFRGKIA
jgi:hypothetical protein